MYIDINGKPKLEYRVLMGVAIFLAREKLILTFPDKYISITFYPVEN